MDTLGIVESKSIAAGVELADEMTKVADVELVRAATICSGRFLIYVSGDRAAVETSVNMAVDSGRGLMGSFVISNISPLLVDALKKTSAAEEGDSIGVIESRNVSSCVNAADCAVKEADVRILRLVAGQGINGKAYFVLGGDVAAVREATEAAKKSLGQNLIEAVVIPRPALPVIKALTSGAR